MPLSLTLVIDGSYDLAARAFRSSSVIRPVSAQRSTSESLSRVHAGSRVPFWSLAGSGTWMSRPSASDHLRVTSTMC